MSDDPKIKTTDGDYKNIYDIEEPHDECADPNDYYDKLFAEGRSDDE